MTHSSDQGGSKDLDPNTSPPFAPPSGLDLAFLLWAKTDRDTHRWHALPYHLIDVGSTAGLLWAHLPPSSRAIAIQAFGDEETAKKCVTFLAAIHDIGKANRFFQAKDPLQVTRLSALRVVSADELRRHGEATTALLNRWLANRWSWSPKAASSIAVAIGGHHGVFRNRSVERLELDKGYVPEVALALFGVLNDLYEVPSNVREPGNLPQFLGWLAGFVSVADWLGSHECMTVWRDQAEDLKSYREEADRRAAKLFDDIHWGTASGGNPLNITDLVPAGFAPNNLQHVASEIAAADFGLVIVEAPTGEGKTETAFVLCEPGRSAGDGLYFALPTMATANGIYGRVSGYLKKAVGNQDLDARLLHSQAWLYRSEVATRSNPNEDESQDSSEDWFAGSKRGLLAPYGVGTIDQCLVGALRAKHGFVRLFALSGKTVVIDEVHAYDVYMSDILERLFGWLRALGCRVILLSATLPASRREALIRAWGATVPDGQAEYPCVTWVNSKGVSDSRPIEVSPRKPVAFELIPNEADNAWRSGADHLLGLIRDHEGFGALILNTVKDAQAAYAHLRDAVGRDVQVELFHARYTLEDRATREKEVLSAYGKDGKRGGARILVGTQVVEQSLDLDFDFMVSALAPIDLLIQRAGRLHRHNRTLAGQLRKGIDPDERDDPTLYVISPKFDEAELPRIVDPVYDHDILMSTLARLEQDCFIREPKHVAEAVGSVYDTASPETASAEWLGRFLQACEKAEAKRERHHERADEVRICEVGGWDLLTEQINILDENDDAPGSQIAARTRLEELPSVNLVLLSTKDDGRPVSFSKEAKRKFAKRTVRTPAYGSCLDELNALKRPINWDRTGASKHAIPVYLDSNGRFETASYEFRYDPYLGLRTTKKNA
jgi:CRISPR-associated endonuclease/helicase Cas3